MRRRMLLATAGSLFAAGCSQLPGPGPTETSSGTDERTDTGTADRTAGATDTTVDTPTSTETDTPTETPTETPTDTPTETAADTPSPAERRAAEQLDTARGHLSDALGQYTSFAGEEATLLDVNATVDVTSPNVTNRVREARTALDEVPSGASDEQQTTVDQLRVVAAFLANAVRCQDELFDAYDECTFVVDRIYAERFGGIGDDISRLRSERDAARSAFQTLQSETDAASMEAFDDIDGETYTQKLDQMASEVTAFDTLAGALDSFRRGMEAFEDATDAYEQRDYRDARELYPTAAEHIGAANADLSDLSPPDSIEDKIDELVVATDSLAAAATDMGDAARAGFRGDASGRNDGEDRAEEHLRSPEFLEDRIDSVEQLLN